MMAALKSSFVWTPIACQDINNLSFKDSGAQLTSPQIEKSLCLLRYYIMSRARIFI